MATQIPLIAYGTTIKKLQPGDTISGNTSTATTLATGRTISLTGDVTYTSPSFDGSGNVTASATVTKLNGTSLSALSTGLLKNTTSTGVPSIAIAGTDYVAPGGALGTPASGTVTNLTGTASININGTVGATTPAAGTFTTLTSTGNATLGDAEATDTHSIKGTTTLLANSASAALTVTQTGAGNAFVVEDAASTDGTPFVVDAVGRIIIGHSAAVTGIFNQAFLEIHNVGGNTAQSIQRYSADAFSPDIDFCKSRNATTGSHTVVVSGDNLGTIRFAGSDGTGFIQAAEIKAEVDGTPGTNDMPGRLVFSTTADGASFPTERMRINSAGNVGIGQTTPTAMLHLKAGTAAAGTGPLKLTAGTNLATPENGAIEFDGTKLTMTDNSVRKQIKVSNALTLPSAITVGASPYTYQNTSNSDEKILISGGTTSLIQFTRDNSNFYTEATLTTDPVVIILAKDDRVKVTYSSTPTMVKIPL